MKTSVWVSIAVVIAVALGAWYMLTPHTASAPVGAMGLKGSPNQGNFGSAGTGSPQGDGTDVSQNLILGVSTNSALGTYLTAYNGMTVYTYAPDAQTPGKSACTDTCRAIWPPYIVGSVADIHVPAASTGITGKVGTITRTDGTLQVTYNGAPLYFYVKDTQAGDTTGQGVGNVWYVIKP